MYNLPLTVFYKGNFAQTLLGRNLRKVLYMRPQIFSCNNKVSVVILTVNAV